ncbi:cell wall hydrolase/autolysin [Segniliparus rotundus DSM 44985]|uniref:Cell wall hydrolase/autolysin n=1 Tax=Segniliparus rotundus (strain ATCC BAA-972 / CDC 1076 / CIP 108378 / DSM 44985 / JCM 13578) TaxID=640132 RepID=D6ZFM5_SEGRD|nr:cell wall hydrolase/autolysin [Segniliparus rotundus DSM 44985]
MKTSKKVGGAVAAALLALSSPGAAFATPGTPAHQGTLAGKTVFLDPGHQAANNPAQLNRQVPDGRGGMKACQTSGMTTVTGVPEHTITWQVAQLVKQQLEQAGARVVLSRQDDTGWGGCVNERAEAENNSGASIGVNIHADSTSTGSDATKHGFHIIVPTLPLPDAAANKAQSWEGRKAAYLMRDSMVAAGFPVSNYLGKNGVDVRSDIAGVNLARVPDFLIEMGNGSNPQEAAQLTSSQGQQRYAAALADGISRYLSGADPAQSARNQSASRPAGSEAGVRGGYDVDFLGGVKRDPAPPAPVYPDPSAGGQTPAAPVAQTAVPSYPGYPGAGGGVGMDPNAGYVDPSLPGVPLTPPAGASPDWTPGLPGGMGGLGQVAPGGGANLMSIATLVPQIKSSVEKGDIAGLGTLIAQQAGGLITSESQDIGQGVGSIGSQIQTVLPMMNSVIPGLSNVLPSAQAAAVVELEKERAAGQLPYQKNQAGVRDGYDVDFVGGAEQEPAPNPPVDPASPVAQTAPAAQQPSVPGLAQSDPNAGYVDPSLPGVPLTPPAGASPNWQPQIPVGNSAPAQPAQSSSPVASAVAVASMVPQIQQSVQKGDVSALANLIAQQATGLMASNSNDIGQSVFAVGSQMQNALPMMNAIVPGLNNMLPEAQAQAAKQLEQQVAAQAQTVASQAPALAQPPAPAQTAPPVQEAPAQAAPAGSEAGVRGGYDVDFLGGVKRDPAPPAPVYPDPSAGGQTPAAPVAQTAVPSYPGYPGAGGGVGMDPNAGYVDPSLPGVPLTPPAGASPDWTPGLPGGMGGLGQVAPGGGANLMSIATLVPQIKSSVEKGDIAGLGTLIAQQAGGLITSESQDIGQGVGSIGSQIQTVLPMMNSVIPGLSNVLPSAQAAAVVELEKERAAGQLPYQKNQVKKQDPSDPQVPPVPPAPEAPAAQAPVAPAPVAPVLPEAPAPVIPAAPDAPAAPAPADPAPAAN